MCEPPSRSVIFDNTEIGYGEFEEDAVNDSDDLWKNTSRLTREPENRYTHFFHECVYLHIEAQETSYDIWSAR